MIFNVIYQNFKIPERLLDDEFINIKRVKLLFHLSLNPPSVIK